MQFQQTPNIKKRNSYKYDITSQKRKSLIVTERKKLQQEQKKKKCSLLIEKIQDCMSLSNINILLQQTKVAGYNFSKESSQKLIQIAQALYKKYINYRNMQKKQQNSEQLQRVLTMIVNYFGFGANYYFSQNLLSFCLKIIQENTKTLLNHYSLAILINLCSFPQSSKFLKQQKALSIINKSKNQKNINSQSQLALHRELKYCLNYLQYCQNVQYDQVLSIVNIILSFKSNYKYFIQVKKQQGYLNTWTVYLIQLMNLLLKVAKQPLMKMNQLSELQDLARTILHKIRYHLKSQDKIHYIYLVKFLFRFSYDQNYSRYAQNRELFATVWSFYKQNIQKNHRQQWQVQLNANINKNIVFLLKIFCNHQRSEMVKRQYLEYLYQMIHQTRISYQAYFCQVLLQQDFFTVQDLERLEQIVIQNIRQDSLIKTFTKKLLNWETKIINQFTRLQIQKVALKIKSLYQEQQKTNLNFDQQIIEQLRSMFKKYNPQKEEQIQFKQ